MPVSDTTRLEDEFKRYAKNLATQCVALLPAELNSDYVMAVFYLMTDPTKDNIVTAKEFPNDVGLDRWVEDFTDGTIFGMQAMEMKIGQTFVVATACPPGTLKHDVPFGFPEASYR